jgi:divalent metal cation (Fe/Co/Zn/Cd) transporter
MTAAGSSRSIVVALAASLVAAVGALGASILTHSSAAMAAAVTALICASSAALILYCVDGAANATGHQHQAAVPTNAHFWSYVAGIGLFSMGAGVALLEGIERLKQPLPLAQADTALLALGIGLAAFVVSIWQVLRISGARRIGETRVAGLRASQDPVLLTVVTAQVAGAAALAVALAGVVLAGQTGAREADGVAALAIGLVLAAVAALLAIEVRRLIMGVQHGTPDPMLTDAAPLLPSMQLAPETKSTDPPASPAPASQSAQKPQIHARDGGAKGRGKHRR